MPDEPAKQPGPIDALRCVRWWWLIGPVLLTAAGVWLEAGGIVHIREKHWELIALWVLRSALLVALAGLILRRDAFALWLLALTATFLMREYHFRSIPDEGIYLAVAVLGAIAVIRFTPMATSLTRPVVVTLLGLAACCYFLAVTLDQRWWSFIPPVAQASGNNSVDDLVEEVIEVAGHLMILTLTLISVAKRFDEPT
jgi:hypothetical protein